MKKCLAILLALLTVFALVACGGESGKTPGGDKNDEGNKGDGNSVAGASYKGNYRFDPPTDNYHIVCGSEEEARVGDLYTYWVPESDGYTLHINRSLGKLYTYYQGQWYNDTNLTYEEYAPAEDEYPAIFGAMEDGLLRYLRAFGCEEDELGEELMKYYVGDEEYCGVRCWVFDSKGINTLYCKYWVDPSNGVVIKAEHYNSSEAYTEALTVYDLNYTKMEQRLYPENYDEVSVL